MKDVTAMSLRLLATDPHYKQLVLLLASIFKEGRYNRALLFDAVLLAEEMEFKRQFDEPPPKGRLA